jgi:hypothetical protein
MPVRIRSFEAEFRALDPTYSKPAGNTFAAILKGRSAALARAAEQLGAEAAPPRAEGEPEREGQASVPDVLVAVEQRAIDFLKSNNELLAQIRGGGVRWGIIQSKMAASFADIYATDAFNKIRELSLVKIALDGSLGTDKWTTSKDADNKVVVRTA